jgi:septal ring-binding cell division protein DamX
MKLAVGTFQAAVLAGGSLTLLLLGFAMGVVATGLAPSDPIDSPRGAASAAAAGPGPAPGAVPVAPGGPPERGYAEVTYDSYVATRSNILADEVADETTDMIDHAASPAFEAATGALQGVLPDFLAKQVPWMAKSARFQARSTVTEGIEGHAKDVILGAAAGAKDGVMGTPAGAAPGAGPASARAAAPADASRAAASSAVTGAPDQPALVGRGAFAIELARFATQRNAEAFAGEIARRGVEVRLAVDAGPDGRTWHSVRAGLYPTADEARAALRRLVGSGFGGTVVSQNNPGGTP